MFLYKKQFEQDIPSTSKVFLFFVFVIIANLIKICIELCFFISKFYICNIETVTVVQLVRALVCGAGSRGFESHQSPKKKGVENSTPFLIT